MKEEKFIDPDVEEQQNAAELDRVYPNCLKRIRNYILEEYHGCRDYYPDMDIIRAAHSMRDGCGRFTDDMLHGITYDESIENHRKTLLDKYPDADPYYADGVLWYYMEHQYPKWGGKLSFIEFIDDPEVSQEEAGLLTLLYLKATRVDFTYQRAVYDWEHSNAIYKVPNEDKIVACKFRAPCDELGFKIIEAHIGTKCDNKWGEDAFEHEYDLKEVKSVARFFNAFGILLSKGIISEEKAIEVACTKRGKK